MGWLEEIDQRWAAATPGPWAVQDRVIANAAYLEQWGPAKVAAIAIAETGEDASATAIASAPSDIARLVAEVKRLKKLETAVRDQRRGSFTGEQDIDDALADLESEVRG